MKAQVWVMPKRTVLDPQGQTIQHALAGLGYSAVRDVRQGKFFVLNLDGWNREEAHKQLEHISKEELTNTVIEESRFEILDLPAFYFMPARISMHATLCSPQSAPDAV